METSLYLKAFFILILLISLIGVVVALMKFFKNKNILGNYFTVDNNLKLEESLNIDHKRRLVTCKFKKKKYLILLGQQDILLDVIIEE
ncbi:MAG: hypothetical protein AB8B46_02900 [Candidatus Midichloriaceae bacterium]